MKQIVMENNFKCNKTGKLLTILNFRTKVSNGKRFYYDKNWNWLDVTKLGSIQSSGIRTETKNRV